VLLNFAHCFPQLFSNDEFPNTQGVDEKTGDVLVQVSEKYFRPTEAAWCLYVPLYFVYIDVER